MRPYIKDVIQHSSRLCEVTVNSRSGLTHILGVYAPHNKMDFDEVKAPFWDMLEDVYSATPLPEPIYAIGDFNVRLQGRNTLEHTVLGPHIFGKGMEFAQRKPNDNRTLYLNLLRGHDSVDCMSFKTPNLKQQVTFRDKTPPPKDWSGFVTDPLPLLQVYDVIQAKITPEDLSLQVADTVRKYLTSDPLPDQLPLPPTNDPLRFQSLDRIVTRGKWLPSVHQVKAVHDTGFPSDHYLLVSKIVVKLGSKIPRPLAEPRRSYDQPAQYNLAFRKFYANSAVTPPSATPLTEELEVYTDGSGTKGKCSAQTPAGWGYTVLADNEEIEYSYGPVIVDPLSPYHFGAEVGSNNTGELQAWMEAASYLVAHPPSHVTFFYDSKWMATMVKGEGRPKRHKNMVRLARLLRDKLRTTTNVSWQWIKGHSGQRHNERADQLADKGKVSATGMGGRYSQASPVLANSLTPDDLPTEGDAVSKYYHLRQALRKAESESFHIKPATPKQPWITEEMAVRIHQVRKLNALNSPEYFDQNKQLKKDARKAKKQWLADTLEANPDPSQTTIWKHLRHLRKGFTERKRRLVVNGRQVPWSKTHQAFTRHLESDQWGATEVTEEEIKILKDSPPLFPPDEVGQPLFSFSELQTALNKLSRGKAPGPDGVRPELLRLLDEFGESQLLDLINTCWLEQKIPPEWKDASVFSFYKGKGDDSSAANYRPISLLNTMYKVYASMIQERLSNQYDRLLRKTQFGFRRGKGTQQPLFIIRRLQDYSARTGQPFQLVFLDWRMAFDKVNHDSLMTALSRLGIHSHYLKVIQDFYTDPTFYTIGLHGDKSHGTPHTGIRQGCPLSPYLFIILMSVLMSDVDERLLATGVPTNTWSVGKPTYDLEYADDTLLFAVTATALEEYLQCVQVEASLYGLSLNFKKTEHLEHPKTKATPLHFSDGSTVPTATESKYLGSQVSWNKPTLTAIQHRINLAHVAFSKLAPYWRSRVPIAAKVRIFQSNVAPVLTHGLASLTFEDKHFQKIDSWYYRYLRRAIGIKASYYSRIPNQTVWKQAGCPVLPSQTILSAQLQQLVTSLATPPDDPLHHVIFSPGYKDRVALQKNSKRGPPPPHWLGIVTSKAMEAFSQQVTQDPEYPNHSRKDFLGLVQYLRNYPSYSSKLVAAPTREAHLFSMYSKSIGSAWRS